jgi:hypothetical protein
MNCTDTWGCIALIGGCGVLCCVWALAIVIAACQSLAPPVPRLPFFARRTGSRFANTQRQSPGARR